MADDRIILQKRTSVGSDSYSEHDDNDGKHLLALNSNFELSKGGRLITVNNEELK